MSDQSFDLLLSGASPEEIDEAVNHETCAMVDWRSEPEEVIEAFGSFLPLGLLSAEETDSDHLRVWLGDRSRDFVLLPELPAIDLADALCSFLPPTFGAHVLRSSLDSDTACYVVRPSPWWREFRARYPERFDLLFRESENFERAPE